MDILSGILNEDVGISGQTMVSLEDLEFLMNDADESSVNGKPESFYPNRLVGNCHSHIYDYNDRTFFSVTGPRIEYNHLHGKYQLSKLIS